MKLTVQNLTSESLSCWHEKLPVPLDLITIPPSRSVDISVNGHDLKLGINRNDAVDSRRVFAPPLDGLALRSTLFLGASWRYVKEAEKLGWRVYRRKLKRKHHVLTILPKRDTMSFLSEIPDTVPLSALTLPGTHDTMALYGWPISQCQSLSTPLAVQLASGIRVLDVRLAVVNNRLISYHGIVSERTRRETLVMSIKQEDFARTPGITFSRLVHEEISASDGGMDMWFLDNRVPNLGEVRGKIVMLSRFGDGTGWDGGLEGMGIHPTSWPDSRKRGFSWQCKNTLVRTHDWYNIPSFLSIPEKVQLATEVLKPHPEDAALPAPTLGVAFFSAAAFPLSLPPTIAKGFGWPKWGFGVEGVNGRLGGFLIDKISQTACLVATRGSEHDEEKIGLLPRRASDYDEPRLRGWALLDFFREPESALVPLLIECNFRGRKSGEEGWP